MTQQRTRYRVTMRNGPDWHFTAIDSWWKSMLTSETGRLKSIRWAEDVRFESDAPQWFDHAEIARIDALEADNNHNP